MSNCILGKYCHDHDFIHGAEAEEHRDRIEKLIEYGEPITGDLQCILDEVDDRDSVAYLEHKDKDDE